MKSESVKPNQGHLVVLEGVDGAGKTTLAEQLVTHLKTKGLNAVYLSFPGREPGTFGAEIYKLHHRNPQSGAPAPHPASLQLLHIAAHIDAIENKILPALNQGAHVVLDRFWWSTWVYGVVSGASAVSLKSMIDVERCHWGVVRPAMAFLILRDKGREDDNSLERQKRIEEYQRLIVNEQNNCPVRVITNNGVLAEGLGKIITELNILDWPLPADGMLKNGVSDV